MSSPARFIASSSERTAYDVPPSPRNASAHSGSAVIWSGGRGRSSLGGQLIHLQKYVVISASNLAPFIAHAEVRHESQDVPKAILPSDEYGRSSDRGHVTRGNRLQFPWC